MGLSPDTALTVGSHLWVEHQDNEDYDTLDSVQEEERPGDKGKSLLVPSHLLVLPKTSRKVVIVECHDCKSMNH